MKAYRWMVSLAIAALISGYCFVGIPSEMSAAAAGKPAKSAAEIEKEKAMQNPYPNDLGPEKLDEAVLKSYPADIQAGYKLLLGSDKKKNCQSCHTASRPLNSRFVEPTEGTDAAADALRDKLGASKTDTSIWQVEGNTWKRYVKRMMAKPGCGVSNEDGKKIWQFLVFDSVKRKTGANAAAWKAHREKLLSDFKAKYPKRYEELAKDKDL
jgi:hypothetical protein